MKIKCTQLNILTSRVSSWRLWASWYEHVTRRRSLFRLHRRFNLHTELGRLHTSHALVMNVAAHQEGNFTDFMKWVQTFTQEHFGLSSSNTGAFLSHPFTCKIFKIKLNMARILNNVFKMSTDGYLITLRNRNMKKHVSLLHRLDHICYISYMMQKAAKAFRIRFESPPTALFTLIIWNSGRMPFWNSSRLYGLSSHERISGRVQIHPAFSETSWKLISSSRKPNQSRSNQLKCIDDSYFFANVQQPATQLTFFTLAHTSFPNVSVLRHLRPIGKPARS